jgi:hypothetical protein
MSHFITVCMPKEDQQPLPDRDLPTLEGTAMVWNLSTGKTVATTPVSIVNRSPNTAFVGNGSFAVFYKQAVSIYKIDDTTVATFTSEVHESFYVTALTTTINGNRVVYAIKHYKSVEDGEMVVWNPVKNRSGIERFDDNLDFVAFILKFEWH